MAWVAGVDLEGWCHSPLLCEGYSQCIVPLIEEMMDWCTALKWHHYLRQRSRTDDESRPWLKPIDIIFVNETHLTLELI
jgi:hypothetical protein